MIEKLNVPGLSVGELAVLNRLVEQLAAKSRRNLLRAAYYDGRRAIRQVGTTIPAQYMNMGIALGWAALFYLAARRFPTLVRHAVGAGMLALARCVPFAGPSVHVVLAMPSHAITRSNCSRWWSRR